MQEAGRLDDQRQRLGVAAVGIPCGVAVIYFGVWSVAAVLALVAALGTSELFRFAERAGARPLTVPGIGASVLLVLAAAWAGGPRAWALPAVLILLGLSLFALGASVFRRSADEQPLASAAVTAFGPAWLGMTLAFGVHLRHLPGPGSGGAGWEGASLLIFPMAVAWIGDSAAYFAGHRWGRRKLIPSVSPGKTVAGALGGLFGAVFGAVLLAALLVGPYAGIVLSPGAAAVVGALVGTVGQIGDLAVSLLKREAGVKDSGGLFPGHGGVLDRFDSILFALPVTYLLLAVLAR